MSRMTASKVYVQLERAGYVCSSHKSGWYVATPRLEYQLTRSASFITNIERMGASPTIQVYASGAKKTSKMVAEALGVEKDAIVVFVQRLFMVAGRPAMVEDLFVQESEFPEFLNEQLDQSIVALWESKYNIVIESFDAQIRFHQLQEPYANLLNVDVGSAGINLTQVFQKNNQRPVGVSQQFWRADVAEFAFSISYS